MYPNVLHIQAFSGHETMSKLGAQWAAANPENRAPEEQKSQMYEHFVNGNRIAHVFSGEV